MMPEPSTLEELLAFVRARREETDVNLNDLLGRDFTSMECRLAARDGMATAFHEIEEALADLIERYPFYVLTRKDTTP
jgi:hypothetical protein